MLSFIAGCLLVIDGIIAALVFLLFTWVGLETVGLLFGAIIGIPVIIWIIRRCISVFVCNIRKCIEKGREQRYKNKLKRQEEEYRRKRQQEVNRRNSFCAFEDGITEKEFRMMAFRAANHIRRLNVVVDAPRIEGIVESQSGISTWAFHIDFNDYGHITGNWWITYCENTDSNIPNRFADLMESEIRKALYPPQG